MMSHRNLSSMALAAMTMLTPMLAAAQGAPTTKYVVLSNVDKVPGQPFVGDDAAIPLLASPAAIPDAAGNIVVDCNLDGNGKCPNVGTGSGGGTAPTAPVVTVNGPPGTVTSSGSSLSWSVSAAKTCVGDGVTVSPASGPAVTGWSKEQPASGGSFSLTTLFNALPANDTEYTYTFSLDCYSSATTVVSGTTVAAVGEGQRVVKLKKASGGGGGTDYCSEYYPSGHAARSQPGFTTGLVRRDVAFNAVFATYTGTPVTPVDVLNNSAARGGMPGPHAGPGEYLSVPFTVPTTTAAQTGFEIYFVEPQGYLGLSPASKWELSISPCPGDFRAEPAVDNPNDYYDRKACHTKNSGTTFFTTGNLTGPTASTSCFVKPGAVMYINMTAHDLDGYRANANTQPVWGCETGVTQCGKKAEVKKATGF